MSSRRLSTVSPFLPTATRRARTSARAADFLSSQADVLSGRRRIWMRTTTEGMRREATANHSAVASWLKHQKGSNVVFTVHYKALLVIAQFVSKRSN